MKKIIMLSGIPGSGKSYYSKNNLTSETSFIISSDEIRFSITSSYAIMPKDMTVVYDEMIRQANKLLKEKEEVTVILDSTFLTDTRRNYFIERLEGYDYLELIMLKAHNTNIIYQRNKQRIKSKWVPEDVIAGMIKAYSNPSKENEKYYNEIKEIFIDE